MVFALGSAFSSAPGDLSITVVDDFNGDGWADVVVGTPARDDDAGRAFLVYGAEEGLPPGIDLDGLDASEGFEIAGLDPLAELGFSVRSVGDVNGDGFGDVAIGAPGDSPEYIYTYVRYDGYTRFYSTYITQTYTYIYSGYTTDGEPYTEQRTYQGGYTYSSSYYYGTAIPYYYTESRPEAGSAYIIFGTDAEVGMINVTDLVGDGLHLIGTYAQERTGQAVAKAGDFNGDGNADFAVAAQANNIGTDAVYVLFGDPSDLPDQIDLVGLSSARGTELTTDQGDSGFGEALDGGVDINGDGFGEVIVGAANADAVYSYSYTRSDGYTVFYSTYIPQTYTYTYSGYTENGAAYTEQRTYQGGYTYFGSYYNGYTQTYTGVRDVAGGGQAYIFYGDDELPPGPKAAQLLDGTNGFVFNGAATGDQVGSDVALVDDMNGDGLGEAVIGASGVYGGVGAVYVVFGTAGPQKPDMNVYDLDGIAGFAIYGDSESTGFGRTVAGLGDVNGDGLADIAVADGTATSGRLHVIYGTSFGADFFTDSLDGTTGYTIVSDGAGQASDFAVSVAGGDINGDGLADISIGNGDGTAQIVQGGPRALATLDALDGAKDGKIALAELTDPILLGTGRADSLTGPDADAFLFGFDGDDTLIGGSKDDTVAAGRGNDSANGAGGADTLTGRAGDDTLLGASGEDLLRGGAGADRLQGGGGADLVSGGAENDTLFGGGGDDSLIGGTGDDRLGGGIGADLVQDGAGVDLLRGGDDADSFVLAADGDADRIADFEVGLDTVDISAWNVDFADLSLRYLENGNVVVRSATEVLRIAGDGGEALTPDIFGEDDFIV